MPYYERNASCCPKCGGETYQDSVDVGVGIIHGPRGCVECGWSEDSSYDLSEGRDPIDENGGCIDQFGGYHPPKSFTAKAYRMARSETGQHGLVADHEDPSGCPVRPRPFQPPRQGTPAPPPPQKRQNHYVKRDAERGHVVEQGGHGGSSR